MICPHCGGFIEKFTRTTDPATSHKAEQKMRIVAENIRGRILVALYRAPKALCDEEIEIAIRGTGAKVSSFRGRRHDLVGMGLVESAKKVTKNSRGNSSIVWGLTLAGIARAKALIDSAPSG